MRKPVLPAKECIMDLHLAKQHVLITGGSKGIGLACASTYLDAGCSVTLVARDEERLEQAKASLGAPDRVTIVPADMAQEQERERVFHLVRDVDILVNNAGAAWGAPAEDHPIEAWDKVMNLNIRGYFLLSQAIAKKSMIARRSGRIINIASITGLGGNPPEICTIAYNTSKGAVINFTRALGAEWGKYNITVNSICPGFFPSRMTQGALAEHGDALAAHAPLGRLGDDEDLKGLCVLYASDAGKHITGQWLAEDGGVSIVRGG
jgi:gluconate 5-dehydrogenase